MAEYSQDADIHQYALEKASYPFLLFGQEDSRLRSFQTMIDGIEKLERLNVMGLDIGVSLAEAIQAAKVQTYENLAIDMLKDIHKAAQESSYGNVLLPAVQPMLIGMILSHGTDNFLAYISELLALVFQHRPQMLKASDGKEPPETVPLDLILKHEQMSDLIQDLVERRVDQLSHRNTRELLRYVSKRLGFALFPEEKKAERLVRIVEQRNIFVHNRGVVNKIFLSRLPSFPAKPGDSLPLTLVGVFDDLDFLLAAAYDIDVRATQHFNLTKPLELK